MTSGIALDDARDLRDAVARYLREEPLDLAADLSAMLRACVVGEAIALHDGISFPPWRLSSVDLSTATEVELTWTIDLGHESGTRRWFAVRAERAQSGWQVRNVHFVQARRRADTV